MPTGPPLGVYPLAPEALMTIEGFRPCSDVPFGAALADEEPPCAMAPFTEGSAAALALLEAPAGPEGVCVAVVVVLGERAGSCAGTAPAGGVEVAECAGRALWSGCGWVLGDAALRMRRQRRGSGA